MYAELDLRFKRPTTSAIAKILISEVAGGNLIDASSALFESEFSGLLDESRSALAAERVFHAATIVYFMEGDDTVKAHIVARSWSEVRKQCMRITRQLSNKIGRLSTANASVYVTMSGTIGIILTGKKLTFAVRMLGALTEKFLSKFVPAAVAFALAANVLSHTSAVESAAIATVAAGIGALVEAAIAARGSGQWKWSWEETP